MSAAQHTRGPVSRRARHRAERQLADAAPALMARAIELALLGDPQALVACLDRAWPIAPAQADKREARALE